MRYGSIHRCALYLLAALLLLGCGGVVGGDDWTPRELRILASLRLSAAGPTPESPSNRVADDEIARELGAKLFFDSRLSGNGKLNCASCHQPGRYFTDGLPRSRGVAETGRNAPTVVGSAYLSWFYWDGRRDSLWAQALIPIEAPDEMGGSRLAAVRLVGSDPDYRNSYEKLFGAFPDELLSEDLPEHAGPFAAGDGAQAWKRMPGALQKNINSVYANIGKTIAAYERTLLPQPSRFDRYVDALLGDDQVEAAKLDDDEIAGLRLFIETERTPCLQCHNGPLLTNGGFHNIGTGTFQGERLDFGRVFGLQAVLMDEFNCLGPYSDAEPRDCPELIFLNRDSHIPLQGAFKVPSLRNLRQTAPYFHDGRFEYLHEVVNHYREAPSRLPAGTHELQPLELTNEEVAQIVAFLESLSFDDGKKD